MKLLVLFACVCVSSAFPENTADVLRFELPPEANGFADESYSVHEVAQILELDRFLQLLQKSGLQETLFADGPFTLFAPTDDAFWKLPADLKNALENDNRLLTDILLYHVVDTAVHSDEFHNDKILQTRMDSASVRINIYGSVDTANGCPISKADVAAIHGVIHVIDKVMFPIPMNDIPTLVRSNSYLSTFMEAVRSAGLEDTLKGDPFTLFIPNNEAFQKLPYGALDSIIGDKDMLKKVLNNHIVNRALFSVGLSDGVTLTTVGQNVHTIGITEGVISIDNKANVIYADATATNGVIHVIDTVLIPDNMKFQLVMT